MYSPATSRIDTGPAGKDAVRLNGAAIETTGSEASAVPATAVSTASVCAQP